MRIAAAPCPRAEIRKWGCKNAWQKALEEASKVSGKAEKEKATKKKAAFPNTE